jgi:para-aminobenzoate synthetase component 1
MEIIHELEDDPRGPYCGSLGYWGFDGAMDLSILIRTLSCRREKETWRVELRAGGGIVADSDPAAEYDETLTKANSVLQGFAMRLEAAS